MNILHFMKWSAINSIFSLSIKITTLVITSWLISPEIFGEYSIGMSIIIVSSILVQMGVPTAIITLKKEKNLTILGIAVVSISFFLFVLLLFLLDRIFSFVYYLNNLFYFLLILFIQLIVNVLESSLRADLKFKCMAIIELFSTFIGTGLVSVVLALNEYGVFALIFGQILYLIIKLFLLIKFSFNKFDFNVINIFWFNKIMKNSLYIMMAEIFNVGVIQLQRPIIGLQLNSYSAGLWSRVYQIILIEMSILSQPIDSLTLPTLNQIKEEKENLENLILSLLQVISFITLSCAVLTVCLAPFIIPILLGPNWSNLIIPLQIGALIIFFRSVERFFLNVSRAIGVMGLRAFIQFIQFILVLVPLYIFAKKGLIFASWVLLLSLAISTIISLYTSKRTMHISSRKMFLAILPGFIMFFISIGVYLMFKYIFNMDYIYSVVLTLVAFVITIFLIFIKREILFDHHTNVIISKFLKN